MLPSCMNAHAQLDGHAPIHPCMDIMAGISCRSLCCVLA